MGRVPRQDGSRAQGARGRGGEGLNRPTLTSARLCFLLLALAACRAKGPPDDGPAPPPDAVPHASAGCVTEPFAALRAEPLAVSVRGERREAIVDAPASSGNRPLPVVLAFHGFRSDARNMRGAGWAALALAGQLIAVHPEGHEGVRLLGMTGRGWDLRSGETRDVDFVRALLDRLEADRCVDRRRIYATGMSNGGFFANLLGCALADRLAAVAPVAGALPLDGCRPARPMPILLVYGRRDEVVEAAPVRGARDWWVGVNGCGGEDSRDGDCARHAACEADVVYCEGPQGHVWPSDATPRIWDFFRAHPGR